jgi:hypothetical protein
MTRKSAIRAARRSRHLLAILCSLLLLFSACSDDSGTEPSALTVAAEISSPGEGSTHVEGDDIQFACTAATSEGDALSGDALAWSSSLTGPIGTGRDFDAPLSEGAHVIQLTATAGGGEVGTDEVSITVLPGVLVAIESPEDGDEIVEGTEIDFTGSATDPHGNALTGGSLVWTRAGVGDPLGTGESIARTLPVGEYEITLTADDGAGHTGHHTIDIEVIAAITVQITSPTAEGSYDENTPVTLSGSAETWDGTPLTGASLQWISSRLGAVGSGESLSVLLPEGDQSITLRANDGVGHVVNEIVQITVGGDGVQFNLTGTWSFSANTPVVQGSYFTADGPLTGFCDIVQVGAAVNLVFTDGYLACDPVWICEFDGTGSNLDYQVANSGAMGQNGEYLTNAISFQSLSATYLDGTQQSVYEHPDGSTSSLYISHFSFSKIAE